MKLPKGWLRHRITVEPRIGASGRGPLYGPARTIRCHLAPATVESQRRSAGDRVHRDSTVAYCEISAVDVVTPDARVTVDGRVVEVLSVRRHEWPRGPTPDHLEVRFI